MSKQEHDKPRIAILGGGPAGLSAAFHLLADGQDRYDVTIYQLGWRLGGKGSTGRNRKLGWRIEEHGIHGFARFYDNTWQMLKQVYANLHKSDRLRMPVLGDPKKPDADADMRANFRGNSLSYLVDHFEGRWFAAKSYRDHYDGYPWDPYDTQAADDEDDDEKSLTRKRLRTLLDLLDEVVRVVRSRLDRDDPGWFGLLPDLELGRESRFADAAEDIWDRVDEVRGIVDRAIEAGSFARASQEDARQRLRQVQARVEEDLIPEAIAQLRRCEGTYPAKLVKANFFVVLALGFLGEGLWIPGKDLDDLDGYDFDAWLKKWKAGDLTRAFPISEALPNILFSRPSGDPALSPKLSTACWLTWFFRTVKRSPGDFGYFFFAGTGESVVLPLYFHLSRLGVRFEFFHKLQKVESKSDADGWWVEKLQFEQQAKLKSPPYDPLDEMEKEGEDRKWAVWPNQPLWDQLANGSQNEGKIDYEAWKGTSGSDATTRVLERSHGDFDYVVFALPGAMVEQIEWSDGEPAKTWTARALPFTATQSAQLWLEDDTADLGWKRTKYGSKKKGHEREDRFVSAVFPQPLIHMGAFDDVIAAEDWGANGPKGCIYLSGQLNMRPRHAAPEAQMRRDAIHRLEESTAQTLRRMGNFLPGSLPRVNKRYEGSEFDLAILHAKGGIGSERLDEQYYRVNTRPTEAYMQAPPGFVDKRPDAWQTGYENMVVAGDWIRTGLNLGSFESAITGGKLAAFALTGSPDVSEIHGYLYFHPQGRRRIRDARDAGELPKM